MNAPARPASRWLAPALRVALVVIGSAPFWVPPLQQVAGLSALARLFDAWFALHCHREADRSWLPFGVGLAVCVRCTGIYVGLALGALIEKPLLSPVHVRLWVGIAALIMILDVVTEMLHMRPAWGPLRAFSGFFLAYPVGVALVNAARSRTAAAPP
ncbi:MAG TPA: DUF2085 domain-containing protein [Polyangiaceae bacterium]